MSNEDGSLWIVFNGEIYNHGDYRTELVGQGHTFRSRSDTETILHLLEQHGEAGALRRMNGMFALAVWNTATKRLFLARDRVGKKPLYVLQRPDGDLFFASEIKAFVKAGLVDTSRLDLVALDQFWTFGYTMGERTIYEQIRRIPPAHYAVWQDGKLTLSRYWECAFGEEPVDRSMADLADELEALLADAVRIRLISDVPLGLFLSGGIDSSLVAAMAARVLKQPLHTFTISFSSSAHDESKHAKEVAAHLGLVNTTLQVGDDLSASFRTIAAQFDEPFGDASAIPTWFVSKIAREHVTVALTGDGGDELFAGYPWYREALRLWGTSEQRTGFARQVGVREMLRDARIRLAGPAAGSSDIIALLGRRHRTKLFSDAFPGSTTEPAARNGREQWMDGGKRADVLSRFQGADFRSYLVDDVMVKSDRMSMAHALECRSPLLDYRVAEFAARLPVEAKLEQGGRGKRLLREVLARHVPRELFERPKQGFTIPWGDWCRGEVAAQLRKEWMSRQFRYLKPSAADWLLPDAGGSELRSWNAFSLLASGVPA